MKTISFSSLSTYRDALMGIAMLCVFVFHCRGAYEDSDFLQAIMSRGYMGVAVFMFLSSIGLSYSMNRNDDILAFYKRRLFRIFPTYWLVMTGVYAFVAVLIHAGIMPANYYRYPHTIWEGIQTYTTIGYWMDGGVYYLWYVPAIIVLYLFFPFIYKMFARWRWSAVTIAIVPLLLAFLPEETFGEYAYFLSFVGIFMYGALVYYWVKSDKKVNSLVVLMVGIGALGYYMTRSIMHLEGVNIPVIEDAVLYATFPFMLMALTTALNVSWIEKPLAFVGKITLEFYLIHEFILRAMVTVSNKAVYISSPVQQLIGFALSLAIAYAIHQLMSRFMEKSRN